MMVPSPKRIQSACWGHPTDGWRWWHAQGTLSCFILPEWIQDISGQFWMILGYSWHVWTSFHILKCLSITPPRWLRPSQWCVAMDPKARQAAAQITGHQQRSNSHCQWVPLGLHIFCICLQFCKALHFAGGYAATRGCKERLSIASTGMVRTVWYICFGLRETCCAEQCTQLWWLHALASRRFGLECSYKRGTQETSEDALGRFGGRGGGRAGQKSKNIRQKQKHQTFYRYRGAKILLSMANGHSYCLDLNTLNFWFEIPQVDDNFAHGWGTLHGLPDRNAA